MLADLLHLLKFFTELFHKGVREESHEKTLIESKRERERRSVTSCHYCLRLMAQSEVNTFTHHLLMRKIGRAGGGYGAND